MADKPIKQSTVGLLDQLAQHPRELGYALIGLVVLLSAIPITAGILYGSGALPVIIWGIFLDLFVGVLTAIFLSPGAATALRGVDRVRMQLLVLAAGTGLATVILGMYLACFVPEYRDVLTADLNTWRKERWILIKTLSAILGGLVLMFLGLLMAQGYERTRPVLRRLLYGYNAILSSVLLFFILLLVNILSYSRWIPQLAFFSRTMDWTASGSYSLSPRSIEFLKALKAKDLPVKVYVLLRNLEGSRVVGEVESLLENCRTYDPRITPTFLSPDRNQQEIKGLIEKYKLQDAQGMLVVANPESDQVFEFIPRSDLSNEMSGEGKAQFNGEAVFIKTLEFLSSGKAKTVVYFTQGEGELKVSDRGEQKLDSGLGKLWDRLGQENYDLKEFKFGENNDDLKKADVVVMAGGNRYTPGAVDALRKYLKGDGKKQGKLVVLMDSSITDGKMLETGLEPLLGDYNVSVQKDMVLTPEQPPRWDDPRRLFGIADPNSDNPISRAFLQGGRAVVFAFNRARSVQAGAGKPGQTPFTFEPMIITLPQLKAWNEPNLTADPFALAADRFKNERLMQEAARNPPTLAAAILQSSAPQPQNPMAPPPETTPVLVVFGSTSWVSNKGLTPSNYNLFTSCVSWLRGKPDLGPGPDDAKTRNSYQLQLRSVDEVSRLVWLPGFVILITVLVLGGGVWVVRRR